MGQTPSIKSSKLYIEKRPLHLYCSNFFSVCVLFYCCMEDALFTVTQFVEL